MLTTTYDGKELMHRQLWKIVEAEAALAEGRQRYWRNPAIVAMVFAFHTVEAYLNYVGETLAPEIWRDERTFFQKNPYRGWNGKLRKVMELVSMPWPDEANRPLRTVLELKQLRDLIAHGKSEKLTGAVTHDDDSLSSVPPSTLVSMVTPKEKLKIALSDVEQFLDSIHSLAAPKTKDIWFGKKALRGPSLYAKHSTSRVLE